MKKLFSLVCALALVLAANAASFNHPVTLPQLHRAPALAKTVGNPVRKAPAAQMETVDLSSQIVSVECAYYSNPSYSQPGAYDYYFLLSGNEGLEYGIPEPAIMFDLYLPTNTGLVDGTYTMAAGQLQNIYLFLEEMDYLYAYYYGYFFYEIQSASLTISTVRAGVYNLSLTMTDTENDTYTVTKNNVAITVVENTSAPDDDPDDPQDPETGLDYTFEPTQPTTINFVASDCQLDDYIADYGEVLLQLSGTEYRLVVEMFLPALDANGNIPAGTYQVSNSQADNTVYASPGGDEQYDYGTFVMAGFNAQGQYTAAYYVISGSMTVGYTDGNMNVTFTGTSYNGSSISVTYGGEAPSVALGNVDASAADKFLRDGQVLIRKNGRVYNAFGQTVE